MSFHNTLQRLRGAVETNPPQERQRGLGTRSIVEVRDLAELLYHFDRLDAESRMGYPPHIKELADAAEKALPLLGESDAGKHLAFALSLIRPNAKLTCRPGLPGLSGRTTC